MNMNLAPNTHSPAAIVAKQLVPVQSNNNIQSGLSLQTAKGEIICFMGIDRKVLDQYIRTLAGIHPIESGTLEIFQQPVEEIPAKAWSSIRTKLAYISRDVPLLSVLNGLNNVIFPALYHGTLERHAAIKKALAIFTELEYSGNNLDLPAFMEPIDKVQLAIARAIMLDPTVLLLDDPWYSLDPHDYSKLNDFFYQWVKNGTIIMTTSNISFVRKYATKIYFIGHQEIFEFSSWPTMCHSEVEEVRHYLRQYSESS